MIVGNTQHFSIAKFFYLSFVTIKVYDVLGNEVATIVNEEKPAGSYEVEFDGTGLTSGIHFYQLSAQNYIKTLKMMFIK
jgi:hypothetical protein